MTPDIENIVVSPADGKIVKVGMAKSPDNLMDKEPLQMMKVSIFMNVFNVHVNRIQFQEKWCGLNIFQELS